MVIKSADDRSADIAELKALLNEPKLSSYQRKLISNGLWNLEKGAWGEKQAAYYLNLYFRSYKRTLLLHDLRIELSNGDVAQIDHLIIDRFLNIYVLESKNWSHLTVDKIGDCTAGRDQTVGVENPLEQCERQAKVLKRAFELDTDLKKLAPRYAINCRVLVAPQCNLKAPHHRKTYFKADTFHTAWCKEIEDGTPNLKNILSLTRMSSVETMQKIGEVLLGLHSPNKPNWRAKFGLASTAVDEVLSSIPGLVSFVPSKGSDWFILTRRITVAEKQTLNQAGYFGRKADGEWMWELKR